MGIQRSSLRRGSFVAKGELVEEVEDLEMIAAGIPEGHARRAKMGASMEHLEAPLMRLVSEVIDTLAARPANGRACQVRLAGYAQATFPKMLGRLSAGDRAAALGRVEKLRDGASGDYREALGALARAMGG